VDAASDLAAWSATQDGRKAILIGGAVAVSAAAVGLILLGLSATTSTPKKSSGGKRGAPDLLPPIKRGRLLCPREVRRIPADARGIKRNDFVVLQIISDDQSFVEQVWGHVSSVSPDKSQVLVQIAASMIATGLSSIGTDKHGFAIGEKVKVSTGCIFDILQTPEDYQVICGVLLEDLGYQAVMGYENDSEVPPVKRGDFVTIVVGNRGVSASSLPGTTWSEALRISVTSTGNTGSVIHGLVWDEPKLSDHGLSKFSEVEFTRDCIVKD
jgi:hypothetical protein